MDLLFGLLRVISLLLISCVHADPLESPYFCFRGYPASRCLTSVEYPVEFGYLSSDSCGYPGFKVDCNFEDDEKVFINISNHIYHVRGVGYESKYIKLADIDVEGSGCPRPKRNFSFPSSPSWVNYHLSRNNNITIFYNCSKVPADAEKHLLCTQEDINTPPSYAFYDNETREGFDWYGNCAQNVAVPFSYNRGNYSDAIKAGFYMAWSATDWCEDCELSGGLCWSNSTATGCACKNGKSYNRTCPQDQGLRTGLKIGIGECGWWLQAQYLAYLIRINTRRRRIKVERRQRRRKVKDIWWKKKEAVSCMKSGEGRRRKIKGAEGRLLRQWKTMRKVAQRTTKKVALRAMLEMMTSHMSTSSI